MIEELDEIAANYVLHYDLPLSPVVYDIFEYEKIRNWGLFSLKMWKGKEFFYEPDEFS